MANKLPMKILGVDTSLRSSGYAIVQQNNSQLHTISYGTIKNKHSLKHSSCLHKIYTSISNIILEHQPTAMAVEGIFYAKNAKTSMILGQARGAVLAAGAAAKLPIFEYEPRRVKQAIVGTGTARKEQVAHMIMRLLGLNTQPAEDEADALAIAICHIHSATSIQALQPKEI